MLTQAKRGT